MKMFIWNIRGLGQAFTHKFSPTILVLLETKLPDPNLKLIRRVWGKRPCQWVSLSSNGASRGIWVVWDPSDLSLNSHFIGEFSITLLLSNILDGTGTLDYIASLPHPIWCVGGDFNVVHWSHERNSSTSVSPDMRNFSEFISRNELIDIPLQGCQYTWSNHDTYPSLSKLDRFLISINWEEQFPISLSMALPKFTSDHCPILLDTNAISRGPRPFRFELHWLQEKGLLAPIQTWWNSFNSQVTGRSGFILQKKIQLLTNAFKS
ncbi:hypothetical protein AMTRI_Chr10g225250 [Amborella trichopoda]